MFDVFGPVKELLSLDPICIDNNIFRLHYKVVIPVIITTNLFFANLANCVNLGSTWHCDD